MPSLKELIEAKKKNRRGLTLSGGPSAPPQKQESKPPEPRELGQNRPGEQIPFEFPTEDKAKDGWLRAKQAFDTEMGIMIDPGENPEFAWIAIQRKDDPSNLILLHHLPILVAKKSDEPF